MPETETDPQEKTADNGLGPIDQDKLAAFIQKQTEEAFRTSLSTITNEIRNQPESQTLNPQTPQEDSFAAWLKPHIDPKIHQATLSANAAMDESRFYRSSEWRAVQDLFDDGDTEPGEVKKQLDQLEEDIEKAFTTLIKQGTPAARSAILQIIMGEKVTKDKDSFLSKLGKRHAKVEAAKVARARSNVDIGSATLASLGRDDILNMSEEKFEQLFAGIQF